MLSKIEKTILRNQLFRHLDGIVTCPAAYVLYKKGVTNYLLEEKSVSLTDISTKFKANDGYLNVALRTLCSQGWLNQKVDNTNNTVLFVTNDLSAMAFSYFHLYEKAFLYLQATTNTKTLASFKLDLLEDLHKSFTTNFNTSFPSENKEVFEQIVLHIEGIIIGEITVFLGMNGVFEKLIALGTFKAVEFYDGTDDSSRLLNLLIGLNWFDKTNDSYEFTAKGLFFAKRSSAYGVTVSYAPTLRKLDNIIFKDPAILTTSTIGTKEIHVDREMNVWGSGGAHKAYFKVIDEIIINLFNKPIDEQPKGILDVGCGNGAFLTHLFDLIYNHTYRGTIIEEHPLALIGVDYNEAALSVTRNNLKEADIWAKVIWGDIGDPKAIAKDLLDNFAIDIADLLNVRTFLDHNRVWETPNNATPLSITSSTGAYAYKGKRLNNNLVIESLKQHFKKWTPYIHKYGLVLVELHTSSPELVAQNIGKTAATAYDATHGYSDQYIIELDAYMNTLESIGLKPVKSAFKKFPNSALATVSINHFKTT